MCEREKSRVPVPEVDMPFFVVTCHPRAFRYWSEQWQRDGIVSSRLFLRNLAREL